MRLIFGMIIGAALTVGGAYIADAMAGRAALGALAPAGGIVNEGGR
jgi:hypothetical protein